MIKPVLTKFQWLFEYLQRSMMKDLRRGMIGTTTEEWWEVGGASVHGVIVKLCGRKYTFMCNALCKERVFLSLLVVSLNVINNH